MNPEGRESAERDDVEDSHAFQTRSSIRLNIKFVAIYVSQINQEEVRCSSACMIWQYKVLSLVRWSSENLINEWDKLCS